MNKIVARSFSIAMYFKRRRGGGILYKYAYVAQIMSSNDVSAFTYAIQYATIISKWINRILISILLID